LKKICADFNQSEISNECGKGPPSNGFFFSAAGQIIENIKEPITAFYDLHVIGSASVRLAL